MHIVHAARCCTLLCCSQGLRTLRSLSGPGPVAVCAFTMNLPRSCCFSNKAAVLLLQQGRACLLLKLLYSLACCLLALFRCLRWAGWLWVFQRVAGIRSSSCLWLVAPGLVGGWEGVGSAEYTQVWHIWHMTSRIYHGFSPLSSDAMWCVACAAVVSLLARACVVVAGALSVSSVRGIHSCTPPTNNKPLSLPATWSSQGVVFR